MASLKSLYEAESGLVAYWPLAESKVKTGTIDLTNLIGTFPGYTEGSPPGAAAGPFTGENVASFNGSTQAVWLGNKLGSVWTAATGVTVVMRLYLTSVPSTTRYAFVSLNGSGNSAPTVEILNGGTWQIIFYPGSGSAAIATSGSALSATTWYQLAVIIDISGDNVKLRVDKTSVFDGAKAFTPTTITHTDSTFRNSIGALANGAGITAIASAAVTGRICHVAMYNKAVSTTVTDSFVDATSGIGAGNACTISKPLRNVTGALFANQTGLKGRLLNVATPNTGETDWKGTFNTDASGLITGASPALVTSLSNGATAWFEWTNSAGVAYQTGRKTFAGPVVLTHV